MGKDFHRAFKIVNETKLQSFQFKNIHNITPCRKYLRQTQLADDDLCSHCGTTNDIFHFFFNCNLVKTLGEMTSPQRKRCWGWTIFLQLDALRTSYYFTSDFSSTASGCSTTTEWT